MLTLKASWRAVSRRKLESIAVIIVIFIGIVGLSSIRLAASYSLDLAGKAWVYEVGNIVIVGDIPENSLDKITSIPGIEKAKLIDLVVTTGLLSGTPVSVALAHNPDDNYPVSYYIEDGVGDVLVYSTNREPPVRVGDVLFVRGIGNITVTGIARGITSISGASDVTLLVDESLLNRAQGTRIQVLLIVAPESDPEALSQEVVRIIQDDGGKIARVQVQTEESNPATKPMRSFAESIEIFVGIALVAASLLIAGSEASLLERNIREIGVLKATGLGRIDAVLYYAGHNLIRAVIAILLGLLVSVPVAEKLVDLGARKAHGSTVMELLMNKYPFTVDLNSLAVTGLVALILVLAASLLPPLIAYQIPAGRALRFTGLTGRARLGIFRGNPFVAYSMRRIASRPWLAAFLILFLAVSWGATASIPMSLKGLDTIGSEIREYGYDGKLLFRSYPDKLNLVVDNALSVKDVERIEVWDFEWRMAEFTDREVSLMSCILGNWSLGPQLAEGRWPEKPGEVAVTETISEEFNVRVGNTIVLTFGNQSYTFKVVGIARDHYNDGLIIYMYKDDIIGITHPNYFYLHYKTSGDPKSVGLEIKNTLLRNGIPASSPLTREDLLQMHNNNMKFMSTFLTIINSSTLIVGVIGLAVLVVVEIAGRLREIGVLRAIGFTDFQILLSDVVILTVAWILSIPLAYIFGYTISSIVLHEMRDAVGYITPVALPQDIFSTSWIIIPSILTVLLVGLLYLRRQPTGLLLRVE